MITRKRQFLGPTASEPLSSVADFRGSQFTTLPAIGAPTTWLCGVPTTGVPTGTLGGRSLMSRNFRSPVAAPTTASAIQATLMSRAVPATSRSRGFRKPSVIE